MKPKIGGKHFQFQIPFDSVSFLRLPLIFLAHELCICVLHSMLCTHTHTHILDYHKFSFPLSIFWFLPRFHCLPFST